MVNLLSATIHETLWVIYCVYGVALLMGNANSIVICREGGKNNRKSVLTTWSSSMHKYGLFASFCVSISIVRVPFCILFFFKGKPQQLFLFAFGVSFSKCFFPLLLSHICILGNGQDSWRQT